MIFNPHNPFDDFKKEKERQIEMANKVFPEQFENREFLKYEDSALKDMANYIINSQKESQKEIESRLDTMISESTKSEKKTNRMTFWTLIIALLTLIATIIGIAIQFF